ncbi:MAG TPA: hypothetical protein VGI93_04165 [Steroidobacteraceae bacterium]
MSLLFEQSSGALKLSGISVFIVEDGVLQGKLTAAQLREAGAWVMGPYGTCQSALRGLARQEPICAVLDICFKGAPDFRIAHALRDKGIPFVVVTALDPMLITSEFNDVIVLERPLDGPRLAETVAILADKSQVSLSRSVVAGAARRATRRS